ncbi:hypothetical protein [Mycolicibacterium goodii]|uniref:hypothetical protein n=1 Tax=Mycolicibacterium goodii TaxID=134601 RepID=UPI000C258E22|nr:hypothetical protein [Mycolicibacterium goodii]PJK23063.1 hypothetical protein CSX11_07590 [Mycolicibacterium goodii]
MDALPGRESDAGFEAIQIDHPCRAVSDDELTGLEQSPSAIRMSRTKKAPAQQHRDNRCT